MYDVDSNPLPLHLGHVPDPEDPFDEDEWLSDPPPCTVTFPLGLVTTVPPPKLFAVYPLDDMREPVPSGFVTVVVTVNPSPLQF